MVTFSSSSLNNITRGCTAAKKTSWQPRPQGGFPSPPKPGKNALGTWLTSWDKLSKKSFTMKPSSSRVKQGLSREVDEA